MRTKIDHVRTIADHVRYCQFLPGEYIFEEEAAFFAERSLRDASNCISRAIHFAENSKAYATGDTQDALQQLTTRLFELRFVSNYLQQLAIASQRKETTENKNND